MINKLVRKIIRFIKYKLLLDYLKTDAAKVRSQVPEQQHNKLTRLIQDAAKHSPKYSPKAAGYYQFTVLREGKSFATHKVLGLLVETREIESMFELVDSFYRTTHCPTLLVCHAQNRDFILQNIESRKDLDHVTVVEMNRPIASGVDVNELYLDAGFWALTEGPEFVFNYQTDGLFNEHFSGSWEQFLKFDYIGAWWNHRIRPNGLTVDGGVGGFSLRNRQLCAKAIEQYAALGWSGGEDDFFAFYIDLLGGRVAKKRDCDRFCMQNRYVKNALCLHQPTNLSAPERMAAEYDYPSIHRLYEELTLN